MDNFFKLENTSVDALRNDCITLIDGTVLQCYKTNDNKPSLPTYDTGRKTMCHHVDDLIKGYHLSPKECEEATRWRKANTEFFIDHAHFFFAHASRILQDSRMFLSPVEIDNGLAYSGRSGFERPTLGIYLEWWINGYGNPRQDAKGNKALVYRLSGSPLSGSNQCSCVYADGIRGYAYHDSFGDKWKSFIHINGRYKNAKEIYMAYTLEEVVAKLEEKAFCKEDELSLSLLIAQSNERRLGSQLSSLQKKYSKLLEKYNKSQTDKLEEDIIDFATKFKSRTRETEQELSELTDKRKMIKQELKQGTLTNVEYQKRLAPIREKEDQLKMELSLYRYKGIQRLAEAADVQFYVMEERLRNCHK